MSARITRETLALLATDQPWAAYALALAANEKELELEPDDRVPASLRLLRSLEGLQFELDGDGFPEGAWEFSVGSPGHLLPEGFEPSRCWTVAGDAGSWAWVARWGDDLSSVELHQVWIRDELDHSRLGSLHGVLADLVFAALEPETFDDERTVTFDDPALLGRLRDLFRDARQLRMNEREACAGRLRAIEARVDDGEESAELLAEWEAAQAVLEELAIASWERLGVS